MAPWCSPDYKFAIYGAREPIVNASEFYQALTNKGFPEHKRDGVRGFRGIRLRQFPMPV